MGWKLLIVVNSELVNTNSVPKPDLRTVHMYYVIYIHHYTLHHFKDEEPEAWRG